MLRPILWLSFGFLMMTGGVEAQGAPPQPVVTAYYTDRPPFTMVEGQTGILIALTKAIFSEAGIRARLIELPQARILDLLQSDSDALAVGWYRPTAEVGESRYSPPFYQESPLIAVLNLRAAGIVGPAPRFDALLTSGLTLGLKTGNSLGSATDRRIRASGVVPLETVVEIPAMLRLVAGGRMDYTLLPTEEAQYLLKAIPNLAQGLMLVKLADPPPGNERSFYYPKGFDPLLADKLDRAIEKLRDSARSPGTARPLQEGKPEVPHAPLLPDAAAGPQRSPAQAPLTPQSGKTTAPKPVLPLPPPLAKP